MNWQIIRDEMLKGVAFGLGGMLGFCGALALYIAVMEWLKGAPL